MRVTRRWVMLAGAVAAAGAVGVGCKGELKVPAACTDTSGLGPPDVQLREALGYVDRTPEPVKTCATCVQWVSPTEDGKCGGCRLLKGPIHPQGSCKAFSKKS